MKSGIFASFFVLGMFANLALAEAPATQGGEANATPLRLWKNRKYPQIVNPAFFDAKLLGGWSGDAWTDIDYKKLGVPEGEDPSERVRVAGLFKK
jgi:hypothetical protein